VPGEGSGGGGTHFWKVGGCNHYDALAGREAIHFSQQLIEGHSHVLLVLGIASGAYVRVCV